MMPTIDRNNKSPLAGRTIIAMFLVCSFLVIGGLAFLHTSFFSHAKHEATTTNADARIVPLSAPSASSAPEARVSPTSSTPPASAGPRVWGRVAESLSGRPIAGVRVVAFEPNSSRVLAETRSDASGAYQLAGLAPDQGVDVVAQPEACAWQTRRVTPMVAGIRCDFLLQPEGVADVLVTESKAPNKPVAGVRVEVARKSAADVGIVAETDAAGRAVLRHLNPLREVNLNITRDGYQPSRAHVRFPSERFHTTARGFIAPRSNAKDTVIGRVVDPTSRPLAGISVRGVITYIYGMTVTPGQTTTAPDGSYRLELSHYHDAHEVLASGAGWIAQKHTLFNLDQQQAPLRADFVLTPGHWLAGVVVDPEGRPLPGMLVQPTPRERRLNSASLNEVALETTLTNAQGRFRLEGLPAEGGFRLEVRGENYLRKIMGLTVAPDRELRIVMRPSGALRGRVIDAATRQPVPNFTIRLKGAPVEGDRTENGQAFSDPAGRFTLDDVLPGNAYELTVDAAGYPPQVERNVVLRTLDSREERVIELQHWRELRGLLLDLDSGKPIAGASVVYARLGTANLSYLSVNDFEEGSENRSVKIVSRQKTGRDGLFTIPEGKNEETLFIQTAGHPRLAILPEDRARYRVGGMLVIRLGAQSTLAGRALLGGVPRAGAFLTLAPVGDRRPGLWTYLRTGADGSYRFEGLNPGDYSMTIQLSAAEPTYHSTRRLFSLASGERKIMDLGGDMGPCSLEGMARKAGQPVPRVIIRLTPQFPWDYQWVAVHTDARGRYRATGLRPGVYTVNAGLDNEDSFHGEHLNAITTTLTVGGVERRDFDF